MILAIGEILVDRIVENGEQKDFLGGASVNMIINAKQSGAKCAYVGRVGKDDLANFLNKQMQKANLDRLDLQFDSDRKTTVALVTLTDGERDFRFVRENTADYHLDFNAIDFNSYKDLNHVHLSSLIISEKEGAQFLEKVVEKVKSLGIRLSFDVNFRSDVFPNVETAIKTYLPFINSSNVVKFSEEEIELFTGEKDVVKGARKLAKKGQLFVITLGSKGSVYYLDGETGFVPTVPVKPVDTTGAGDAYFGTFIANIEGKELTSKNITYAMEKASEKGAKTTQFYGAVKL